MGSESYCCKHDKQTRPGGQRQASPEKQRQQVSGKASKSDRQPIRNNARLMPQESQADRRKRQRQGGEQEGEDVEPPPMPVRQPDSPARRRAIAHMPQQFYICRSGDTGAGASDECEKQDAARRAVGAEVDEHRVERHRKRRVTQHRERNKQEQVRPGHVLLSL